MKKKSLASVSRDLLWEENHSSKTASISGEPSVIRLDWKSVVVDGNTQRVVQALVWSEYGLTEADLVNTFPFDPRSSESRNKAENDAREWAVKTFYDVRFGENFKHG